MNTRRNKLWLAEVWDGPGVHHVMESVVILAKDEEGARKVWGPKSRYSDPAWIYNVTRISLGGEARIILMEAHDD